MFRVIIFLLIIGLIIISVGGYIANSAGWLSEEWSSLYSNHFSFITGLASVIGLLAFSSSRKIKSTDFEEEELQKLQSLMKAAQDLEKIESSKNQTEKKLIELERKKKLMELSVKKAGLVLFYKSQIERYEPQIVKKIENDKELQIAVKESLEARSKLQSLNEEIEKDENVELLKSILNKDKREGRVTNGDPILIAAEIITKSMSRFFRI